jgi:hypothetical protein
MPAYIFQVLQRPVSLLYKALLALPPPPRGEEYANIPFLDCGSTPIEHRFVLFILLNQGFFCNIVISRKIWRGFQIS